jgi:hypothetical protein
MSTVEHLLDGGVRKSMKQQFVLIRQDQINIAEIMGSIIRYTQEKYQVTVVNNTEILVRADKKRNIPLIIQELQTELCSLISNPNIDIRLLFQVEPTGNEIMVRAKRYNG